jgi:hypothetical protein
LACRSAVSGSPSTADCAALCNSDLRRDRQRIRRLSIADQFEA